MNNKKILFGGDGSTKKIETFLSIIIIGYFGIKIIYGLFFNYYPEKYYYRNIDISTNDVKNGPLSKGITLNAYVPGIWNNELTDFITLLALSAVVFIYTNVSSKSFIDVNGNLNFSFLIGYILGLGYPVLYASYGNLFSKEFSSSIIIKSIYYVVSVALIIFIIIMNFMSANSIDSTHKISYTVYVIVFILLFFGLILSKKDSKNYNSVTYFYNNGTQCTFAKNGVFQSSGDIINITLPFLVFIILLLFSYEPSEISIKNIYIFIYGLLLGILVSGISYFGIEYFLQKVPEKECTDLNECILKEMPKPVNNDKQIINSNETIDSKNNVGKINKERSTSSIIKIVILLLIILIIVYLVFYYFFL